jgi:carboxypeptidase Q
MAADAGRRALVLASALGLAGCAARPGAGPAFAWDDLAHAKRLRDAALADGQAWRLLQALCTEVGARPAGSAADAQAQRWAQGALRGLGLSNVRAEPFALRVWQRGLAAASLLLPAPEPLVIAALGNSVATPPEGIEAEVAWYPDLAALKADTGDRASGRIVIVGQATERSRDGRGYGAAFPARMQGPDEAARRGALAFGVRSLGTSGERIAHTGAMSYELGVPRIPAFALAVPDALRIAALHAAGTPMRLRLQLESRSGVEATSANVIGEIPGTDLADQVVLISAHLDSWDVGQGAVDDGAGVAIVSAAAGLIARAGRRPRRTVRVVLFGNEENGFDGARHYGDRHGQQPHQWVGESDFGAGRPWQLRARVKAEAVPLVARMAEVLAPVGLAWPPQGANEGTAGPDAAVLGRRFNWPMVQVHQDGSAYFDVHHTVHDTVDRVDPATLPPNVAAWAVTAWLAAQSPLDFFPRA